MSKFRVYLMGLLTLLMVPLAWLIQFLPPLPDFFQLDSFFSNRTLVGVEFGVIFGVIMVLATATQKAQISFKDQIRLIRSFNLSLFDCVFLSLCAGIGEEYLFRIAIQEWVHPLLTAVIFVAIHGYIRPRDWETTKFGLLILVFIIVLSYAVYDQGIWFCIGAHAAYDFVLFYHWSRHNSEY